MSHLRAGLSYTLKTNHVIWHGTTPLTLLPTSSSPSGYRRFPCQVASCSHTISLWHLHASQAHTAGYDCPAVFNARPLYFLHLTIFSFFVTRDLVCHYHVCRYLHAVSHVAINSNLQQKLALPGHDSSPQPPTRSGSHCLCSGSHFPHCPCVASASRRDAANEVTFQQDDTLKAAMLSQLDTACQDLKSQEASRAVSTPTRDGSYIGSH